MSDKYSEEMAEAMAFLSDILIEADYTPAKVRRLAEIVRDNSEDEKTEDG